VALVLHERPPHEIGVSEDRCIHAYVDIAGQGARSVYLPYSQDEGGNLKVGDVVRLEKPSHFF
jgi:hypothetical protein